MLKQTKMIRFLQKFKFLVCLIFGHDYKEIENWSYDLRQRRSTFCSNRKGGKRRNQLYKKYSSKTFKYCERCGKVLNK